MPACGRSRLSPIQSKYRFAILCPQEAKLSWAQGKWRPLRDRFAHGNGTRTANSCSAEQKEVKQSHPRRVFQWKQRVRPEPADAAVETKVPVQHFVNLFVDVLEYILLVGQLIFHVSFDGHGLKRSLSVRSTFRSPEPSCNTPASSLNLLNVPFAGDFTSSHSSGNCTSSKVVQGAKEVVFIQIYILGRLFRFLWASKTVGLPQEWLKKKHC